MGWKTEERDGYCEECEENVLIRRENLEPNHVLHLLITLFSCGLWAVVWLVDGISCSFHHKLWRCARCGSVAEVGGKTKEAVCAERLEAERRREEEKETQERRREEEKETQERRREEEKETQERRREEEKKAREAWFKQDQEKTAVRAKRREKRRAAYREIREDIVRFARARPRLAAVCVLILLALALLAVDIVTSPRVYFGG